MTTPSTEGERISDPTDAENDEHFRPTGTAVILAAFLLTLILLWLSVYVILLSRGVTA